MCVWGNKFRKENRIFPHSFHIWLVLFAFVLSNPTESSSHRSVKKNVQIALDCTRMTTVVGQTSRFKDIKEFIILNYIGGYVTVQTPLYLSD